MRAAGRRRARARVRRASSSAPSRRRRCPSGSASRRRCSSSRRARIATAERRRRSAAALDARVDGFLEKRRWMLARAARSGDEHARRRSSGRLGRSSRRRCAVIALFFVAAGASPGWRLSFTDFDIYALADLRNLRFAGPRQLRARADAAAVLEGARQHAVLRRRRRAAVDRAVARLRGAAAVAAGALQAVLSHRAVRAGGDDAGRGRRDLALPVPRALRPAQRMARRASASSRSTGSAIPNWAMPSIILFAVWKNFGANMIIFIAALQAIPDELYEAARIDGAVALAAVRARHAADARADAAAGQHPDDGRLLPALRRAVRDDAGRPAARARCRCCT